MTDDPRQPEDEGGFEKNLERLADGFNRMFTPPEKGANVQAEADFFRAVKANNKDEIQKLLDAGIDPNIYNKMGLTALHVAAGNNAVEAARLLLARGANPRLGKQGTPEHTPLDEAVNFNKPEMVELLARQGGYVPGAKINGWSVLHRACEKGRAGVVEALLNAGADCNETTGNGSTPLLIAAKLGHVGLVETLLKFPAVVETMNDFTVKTDDKKRSAFFLAATRGHAPIISAMIGKGADVNARDGDGFSLMYHAVENGNAALVRLLAKEGADLNLSCGPACGTALVHALMTHAITDKARAEIVDVLLECGADTEILAPWQSPLLCVVFRTNRAPEVLSSLLRYPLNPDVCDTSGETPLIMAAQRGTSVYVDRLLEAGANPNGRHGDDARTPLIQAARFQRLDNVRALLKAGANPKLCDGEGKSALFYARERGNAEIIQVLEQALQKKIAAPQKKPSSSGEWEF